MVIDPENKIGTHLKDILKHSFNIKELIEDKDIIKVKTKENAILMIGFDEKTIDIKYKEIIEEIEIQEIEEYEFPNYADKLTPIENKLLELINVNRKAIKQLDRKIKGGNTNV